MIQTKINNFTVNELKCHCCGLFTPDSEALICLQGFRYFLNHKYKKNIRLNPTCGTRCYRNNKRVKGVKNSLHLTGQAFDLTSYDIDYKELYKSAVESKLFSTVIRYDKSKFIHVDVKPRKDFDTLYFSWYK